MHIVTGANGRLGRGVVEELLQRLEPSEVGVSVRDVDAAADLAARGVRVRRGDFADPGSLDHAFEGADAVLVVSIDALGDDAVAAHRAAFDAAVRAGARRVAYTSHMGARHGSPFAPAADHARGEEALAASGVAWTALRNGFHASSGAMLVQGAMATGELAMPADGPVAWTAHADLAGGAAAALLGDERLDGATPPLTGREAVDMAALAEVLSELRGERVRHVVLPVDEWVAGMVAHGAPEPAAHLLLGLFHAAREGDFATAGSTLEQVLGRPPLTIAEAFADELERAAAARQ